MVSHLPLKLTAEACQQRTVQCSSSYKSTSRRIVLGSVILPVLPVAQIARADNDPAFAYDTYAEKYDDLDDGSIADALGINELREQLIPLAQGFVLEVGVGTGINLRYYNEAVTRLVALDYSEKMLQQAKQKAERIPSLMEKTSFLQGSVDSLAFPDSYFDTVIDTFSMCVFSNPQKAISEMKRVLKSDGKLLLLEHTKSQLPGLGTYQDIVAKPVKALGKGCAWNQNVDQIISDNGLNVKTRESRLAGLVTLYTCVKKDM